MKPSPALLTTIGAGRWSLDRARSAAAELRDSSSAAEQLFPLLFSESFELRKRAADVARRMTERLPKRQSAAKLPPGVCALQHRADELLGLLASIEPGESRTRWHLGLVVARVAHTREQRLRAARTMEMLARDERVVVRCSGIEGIALLAAAEPSVRASAEEICCQALATGTPAERCRARDGRALLERADRLLRVGRAHRVD